MAVKVFYKRRGGKEGENHTGSEGPGAQGLSCHHLQDPEQHGHRRPVQTPAGCPPEGQRPRVEGGQLPGGEPCTLDTRFYSLRFIFPFEMAPNHPPSQSTRKTASFQGSSLGNDDLKEPGCDFLKGTGKFPYQVPTYLLTSLLNERPGVTQGDHSWSLPTHWLF